MNKTLVDSIRQKLETQNNTQLLEIWIENNTHQWSAETFEAIKQILTSRGVPLPIQKTPGVHPIPVATKTLTPDAEFWLKLLRPILYIAIAMGCIKIFSAMLWLAPLLFRQIPYSASPSSYYTTSMLFRLIAPACLSLLLIYASWSCLKLKPHARVSMIIYFWVTVGIEVCIVAIHQYQLAFYESSFWGKFFFFSSNVIGAAMALSYPLLLYILMLRPEIRKLYRPSQQGFEPVLPGQSR
jgi:hypothetical protein